MKQPRAASTNGPRTTKRDMRRNEITPRIRKALVQLAFEEMDPDMTGEVDGKLLNNIRDELADLIRKHATTELREKQYFISEFGQDSFNALETEEKRAHEQSMDLADPEKGDDGEDVWEQDDLNFLAPDDDEGDEGDDVIDLDHDPLLEYSPPPPPQYHEKRKKNDAKQKQHSSSKKKHSHEHKRAKKQKIKDERPKKKKIHIPSDEEEEGGQEGDEVQQQQPTQSQEADGNDDANDVE